MLVRVELPRAPGPIPALRKKDGRYDLAGSRGGLAGFLGETLTPSSSRCFAVRAASHSLAGGAIPSSLISPARWHRSIVASTSSGLARTIRLAETRSMLPN